MKLRIKFSNTLKFCVEVSDESLKSLKDSIANYLLTTQNKKIHDFSLSFNGKDPIVGDDSSSLSSLGIVKGDLLTVIEAFHGGESVEEVKVSSSKNVDRSRNQTTPTPNRLNETRSMCSTKVKVSSLLEARDGILPPSVFEHFERYSPTSPSEAINLLVHINMIETGFVLGDSPANAVKTLPMSWKEMAATLKYHHPGFNDFDCTIVIVTMGNVKQILASFTGQENEISVRVEVKEYMSSTQILPHRLTKVAQFAKIIRNNLLYPLQVAAHLTLGVPAPWHLIGLPNEILIKISTMLSLRSVLNLSSTCKRLNSASKDNKLWYNLFKRDFHDQYHSSDTISGADWQPKYRAAYEKKKERESSRDNRRFVLEDPVPNQIYPPGFPNPYRPDNPNNPYMPQPRGPNPYYPPQPDPQPNPYWDPDSPYFGGEIPPPPGPFPGQPNPLGPFGGGRRPRRPNNPLQPPFMPPQPGFPRGPRFDFF